MSADKAGPSLPWGKGAASTTTALTATTSQATPASTSLAQDGQLLWDGYSLALGSLFGIPIRVHVSTFAVTLICTLAAASDGYTMGLIFMLYGPILYGTVLIHELGHCYAAHLLGQPVHGILLWPLGGLAMIGKSATTYDDLRVSIAGPVTHIPMLLFWLTLMALGNKGDVALYGYTPVTGHFWADMCSGAMLLNVGLFLFNVCIPAYPLDGGRIFIDTLLMWEVSMDNTASACVVVNAIVGVLLLVYGITSFPGGTITILIASYILWQAYLLVKHQSNGTLAQHELFQNAASAPAAPAPNYSTTVTNPIANV